MITPPCSTTLTCFGGPRIFILCRVNPISRCEVSDRGLEELIAKGPKLNGAAVST